MLKLIVPGTEYFNEETSEFETIGDVILELEHSLVSLSKWESKFEKPFLGADKKTPEEIYGYVRAMIITEDFSEKAFQNMSQENLEAINTYIESKQTATTFGEMPQRKSRGEVITSELIYYWMVAFNIPFSCETWHLNRLFALIRICNIKNQKPRKMSRHEIAMRNREINAQRKAELASAG